MNMFFGFDSIFLFIGVLCVWILLSFLGKTRVVVGRAKLWMGLMICSIAAGVLPIILIKEGVLSSKPGNILIAGISAIYVALFAGRLANSNKN